MTSKILYQQFFAGIRWNAIETIIFSLIFLTHQFFLFKTLGGALYGLVGTLFASLYLVVKVANFGLDKSLGTLFSDLSKDKNLFRSVITKQLRIQLAIFFVLSIIIFSIKLIDASIFKILSSVEYTMLAILLAILVVEGVKKTVRMLLQLAFLNKQAAFVELGVTTFYFIVVWGLYLLGYSLLLVTIFVPFLVFSVLSTACMMRYLHVWYQTLPEGRNHEKAHKTPKTYFLKNRFFNTFNDLGSRIFTGNFLVVIAAYKFGMEYAAFIKLATSLFDTVSIVIYKTFGWTSYALFAHMKSEQLDHKKKAFSRAAQMMVQVLYGLLLFTCINYQKIATLKKVGNTEILTLCVLYAIGYLISIYEQFYVTQDSAGYLLIFNSLSLFLCGAVVYFGSTISTTELLLSFCVIRLIVLAAISIVSFYLWGIKSTWSVRPMPIIGSLTAALFFFAVV